MVLRFCSLLGQSFSTMVIVKNAHTLCPRLKISDQETCHYFKYKVRYKQVLFMAPS